MIQRLLVWVVQEYDYYYHYYNHYYPPSVQGHWSLGGVYVLRSLLEQHRPTAKSAR